MRPPLVLVTGSTDGIGRETALELARRGALVIAHGRNPQKVAELTRELAAISGPSQPEGVVFDLSDFEQLRRGAAALSQRLSHLDVLLHNAGIFDTEPSLDAAGLERTWKVNHLAPMLLTHGLLPTLRSQPGSRVVIVASVAHVRGQIRWEQIQGQSGYAAYAQSKLANIMFANGLSRRFAKQELGVFSLHPGVVGTKLLRAGFGMEGPDSLAQGAATSVHCALAPELTGQSGLYFVRSRATEPAPQATNPHDVERLWQLSCQQLGLATDWS
jgi:NAD(P)-dependent dehydrogenase (short-subunit alcohol dehydrogenase family)